MQRSHLLAMMLGLAALAAFCPPLSAKAEIQRATAQLSNSHQIAANWQSSQTGSADVTVLFDRPAGQIVEMRVDVHGISAEELAAAGPDGILGAIHIHNYPQGGPNFFVQQLPGQITPTDDGFTFLLSDWHVEGPKAQPHLSADFVLAEIEAGNAYVGLHTSGMHCPGNAKGNGNCAAPGTALAGHLTLSPEPARAQQAAMK